LNDDWQWQVSALPTKSHGRLQSFCCWNYHTAGGSSSLLRYQDVSCPWLGVMLHD